MCLHASARCCLFLSLVDVEHTCLHLPMLLFCDRSLSNHDGTWDTDRHMRMLRHHQVPAPCQHLARRPQFAQAPEARFHAVQLSKSWAVGPGSPYGLDIVTSDNSVVVVLRQPNAVAVSCSRACTKLPGCQHTIGSLAMPT